MAPENLRSWAKLAIKEHGDDMDTLELMELAARKMAEVFKKVNLSQEEQINLMTVTPEIAIIEFLSKQQTATNQWLGKSK